MGNGTIIYGAPMSWDEICQLVTKYIEKNPDSSKRKAFRVALLHLSLQEARDQVPITTSNHAYVDAQLKDGKLASEMARTLGEVELNERIKNLISSVFVKDRFDFSNANPRCSETFERLSECLLDLLEVGVRKHGPCCIEDFGEPFFIGDEGEGCVGRGDPSCPIKLPTKESQDFVDKLLGLIDKEANYHIVAIDCDSCT